MKSHFFIQKIYSQKQITLNQYSMERGVKIASKILKQGSDVEYAPGGDRLIPCGDHANLCLAWCKVDVHLAHILMSERCFSIKLQNKLLSK